MSIAGSPGVIEDAAATLDQAAADFTGAADSIGSHGRQVTADWVGTASDAASDAITVLATRTRVGADVTGAVGPVLRTYAAELRGAQSQYDDAAASAGTWGTAARSARGSQDAAARMPTKDLAQLAARDDARAAADAAASDAAAQVAAAHQTMAAAVARAERANQTAADAVDALTEQLAEMGARVTGPPPPVRDASGYGHRPWYERAWGASESAVSGAAHDVADVTGSVVGYYQENPDQWGELIASAAVTAGGLALMAAGAGMEVGGVALDATGIGALVGVPANIAGAAVIASGATLAAGGTIAMGQDLGTMMQERDTSVTGGGRSTDPSDIDEVLGRLDKGKQSRVRVVDTDGEVQTTFDELAEGGVTIDVPGYRGTMVERPDGTRVGLRETSKSGGRTVDVFTRDGTAYKVHLR